MKEQLAGQSVKLLINQAVGFFEADAVGSRWVRSHPSWKSIWVGFHPKFRRRHRSLISAQQSAALRVLARTNKPHQNPMGQGAQPPARLIGLYQGLFQSTRPRRARLVCSELVAVRFSVSIHAPAKGATFTSGSTGACFRVSIHAPAKGAPGDGAAGFVGAVVSIHAPAKGATTIQSFSGAHTTVSIHAPAKGATCDHLRLWAR